MQDEYYMARALKLAQRGRFTTHPNPNVGCVIVKDGEIVGEGYHQRAGEPHAEVHALRMAGEKAKGATAYVTLEPCQMCAGAIVQARIPKVVMACMNPKAGCAGSILNILDMPEFNHQVETVRGVCEEECAAMLKNFFRELRVRNKLEKSVK